MRCTEITTCSLARLTLLLLNRWLLLEGVIHSVQQTYRPNILVVFLLYVNTRFIR